MANWYLRDNSTFGTVGNGTVGWSAVPKWVANTAVVAGTFIRQTLPVINSERVFICIVGGTTNATTEPTWVLTKGAKTTDGTVTWQECTGRSVFNGDRINIPSNLASHPAAFALGAISLGAGSPGPIFIVTTAGTTAVSPPVFQTSFVGQTTTDGTVIWTYVGPNTFPQWSAPFARLATAAGINWPANGDDIYAASDHAEVQSTTVSFTLQGSIQVPCNVWCILASADLSNGPTAAALTSDPYSQNPACAQMTTTGTAGITPTGAGVNINGWVFSCGSGTNAATMTFGQRGKMERCSFRIPGLTSGSIINIVNGDSIDCSYGTGHIAGVIRNNGPLKSRWIAGTAPALLTYSPLVIPTILVNTNVNNGDMVLDGLDLSNVNTTLVGAGAVAVRVIVSNCKTHLSVVNGVTPTDRAQTTDIINCDYSGGLRPFRHERWRYEGNLQISPVYRTGGVTDAITGTPYCWFITTTANAKWLLPFESFAMAIWNTVVGSPVTVTIYSNGQGAVPPFNDEIWIEAEYFNDANTPLTAFANSTKANYLATHAAYNYDSSTWTGGAGPFTMTVTVTPRQIGYIYVRIKAAKPSWQFLIDRKIYLS